MRTQRALSRIPLYRTLSVRRRRAWLVLFACGVGLGAPSSPLGAASIAFFVSDAAALINADPQIRERLESLGHEVVLVTTSAATKEQQIESAEAAELVLISESIGSTTVFFDEFSLHEVAVAVISFEPYMWDDAGWTGLAQFEDFGNTGRPTDLDPFYPELSPLQTSIFIVEESHLLAAGLSGEVDVYLEPYSVNFGIPAADAVVVATADEGGEFPTLFIYNEGEALVDDTPAPAKRIGFFLGQNAAPDADHGPIWSNLTEEALALFDAAIECGLSEGDCRVEPAGSLFRRGDADGNGALELTDAVNTLSYQFLGEFGPPCLDALDWDDNGQIEVTDPIGSLTHQFLGGPEPAAPGKETCGADPTDDALDCAEPPADCVP